MRRVRITISPPDAYLPPVYERLTRDADYLSRVQILNWNVSEPPVGFLLRLRGDYRRLDDVLAAEPGVAAHEFFPLSERECHCVLAAEETTVGRALFENFTRGSLLTVPPIDCHDDGSSTFTLLGTGADVQDAVDGVPDGVDVTVEAVGGERVAPDDAVGRLSERQREAAETALALGYYERPRAANCADVARELDCSTSTAAAHLRKAESKVMAALLCG